MRECPPWFEWVNTSDISGYCACFEVTPNYIHCNQKHQTSYLSQGACTFYDAKSDKIWGSWCPFLFPDDVLQDGMFSLPANVSELNTVVCGNLTREVKVHCVESVLAIQGHPYTLLVTDVSIVVQSTFSTTSSYNTDLPLSFFYWSSFSGPTSHQHQ